jgi:hypothetical protein
MVERWGFLVGLFVSTGINKYKEQIKQQDFGSGEKDKGET